MSSPLTPSTQNHPGIRRLRNGALDINLASSPSPHSYTVQLPEYGVFLATFGLVFNNQTVGKSWVTADIVWDGSSTVIVKGATIRVKALSGTITDVTVSSPTDAGVVTVTVTSSDTANRAGRLRAQLMFLRELPDMNLV